MEGDIATIRREVKDLRSDMQQCNYNLARLIRFLMPHEKKLKLPANMPTLPLDSFDKFDKFEKFLGYRVNRDAVVSIIL